MTTPFQILWSPKVGTPAQLARLKLHRVPLLKEIRWGRPADETKTPDIVRPYYFAPRYIIDIETWPLDWRKPTEAQASLAKYLRVLRDARSETPDAAIGLYSVAPYSNYNAAMDGEGSQRWQDWTLNNARVQPIADALDFLCPSLYVFHPSEVKHAQNDTLATWPRYADAMIAQARQLANGKPILPFVWSRYHANPDATKPLGDPLPYETMLAIYRHLHAHADVAGMVLWQASAEPFDETAALHLALEQFLSEQGRPIAA